MSGPAWTAVATAAALGPRGRMRVVVEGAERVLWRSAAGDWRIWGNRCPHRGMRLSFGLVRGDDLVCIYHGWRFGPDGRCAAIPAHPDLTPPATIAAEVHRAVEADGLVWVGGAGARPDLSGLAADPFRPVRSVHVDRPLADLRAAVAGTPPPGWTAAAAGDDLLRLDGPEVVAVAAFHAVDDGRSAVHVVAATADPDARLRLARHLAAVRDGLSEDAA